MLMRYHKRECRIRFALWWLVSSRLMHQQFCFDGFFPCQQLKFFLVCYSSISLLLSALYSGKTKKIQLQQEKICKTKMADVLSRAVCYHKRDGRISFLLIRNFVLIDFVPANSWFFPYPVGVKGTGPVWFQHIQPTSDLSRKPNKVLFSVAKWWVPAVLWRGKKIEPPIIICR